MRLDIEPATYAQVGYRLGDANIGVADALETLHDTLLAASSMAGDDTSSEAFARTYDAAAREAVAATGDVVDALANIAVMVATSSRHHHRADLASTRRPRSVDDVADREPNVRTARRFVPPSSLGADDPDTPALWDLVADHLEGYTWPGADTDRLRSTGRAWARMADALERCRREIHYAISDLSVQQAPEVPLACDALGEIERACGDLAAEIGGLGASCGGYAEAVDATRDTVRGIMQDLALETGVNAALSTVGAIFTAGGAAVAGTAIATARAVVYGRRIAVALRRLGALHHTARDAGRLQRLGHVARAMERFRSARVMDEAHRALPGFPHETRPGLVMQAGQVMRKYKHAPDVDPSLPPHFNRANGELFRQRLEGLVSDPEMITRRGSHRGQPGFITLHTRTGQAVLQHVDGTYWSTWSLSPEQFMHAIKHGNLGG